MDQSKKKHCDKYHRKGAEGGWLRRMLAQKEPLIFSIFTYFYNFPFYVFFKTFSVWDLYFVLTTVLTSLYHFLGVRMFRYDNTLSQYLTNSHPPYNKSH